MGVEGVIDKDFASSLLANHIGAERLVIVTSVDRVAIRFGRPDACSLDVLTIKEAGEYLAAGEFPPGSMGPKVEAAIEFVALGGKECIITSTREAARAICGRAGTHIVAS